VAAALLPTPVSAFFDDTVKLIAVPRTLRDQSENHLLRCSWRAIHDG